MILFGQGIRVTQAIYEDHLLVEGSHVFVGPKAYRLLAEHWRNKNYDVYFDAQDRSLTERRSVPVEIGMPELLKGV